MLARHTMVSTGVKSNELSIKHLAKTFYFVLIFHFLKPNQKDLADLVLSPELWVKHQTRINSCPFYSIFAIGIAHI